MPKMYATVTGSTPISINTSTTHNTSVSMATIQCISTTLDIGDEVTVDLGYTDDHAVVFKGYVKTKEKQVRDDTVILTAYDYMIRAIDYFIVSSEPESPFTRNNISAEDLVQDLMQLAGLAGAGAYEYDGTSFVLGNSSPVEVNLVSVHDFCKMIADALTWNIWADQDGHVHFKNRKPFVMEGDNPRQPGWVADTPVAGVLVAKGEVTDLTYRVSEKDLRNRVVVYGNGNIHAEASAVSPYLPADFYKSVGASFSFIDRQSEADATAAYNLNLLNRLTQELSFTVLGNTVYSARNVYTISEELYDRVIGDANYPTNMNWYCYTTEHNWSRQGYLTTLVFRRGITA